MRIRKFLAILFLVILSITGCKQKQESSHQQTTQKPVNARNHVFSYKPNSGGNAGEVEVVMANKLWEGKVGDTVFYYLTQPFPALPQDEPFFKILHIDPSAFTNIYKEHRNILIFKFSPNYKASWRIQRDVYAYNQLVITYKFPDTNSLFELFPKTVNKLLDTLYKMELYRYQLAYEKFKNSEAIKYLEDNYKIYLLIPNTYQIFVKKPKFLWIGRETARTTQAILVYFTPYTDKIDLAQMISLRDSVTKINVPGPDEGSYMTIEHLYPIVNGFVNLNGYKAFIMRGLWKTHGSFLGGPFVSYTIPDKKHNRLVTIDGFVYAGKLDKKLYLWQVEAILRTFKIVE